MADEKDNEGPLDPIDAGHAQRGDTATGQEAARREGAEEDRISELENRGSTVPTDDMKPDMLHEGEANNQGLQNEPAEFANNGTIPPNMVPSNSGLVPVSAVASSPEDGQRRVEAHRTAIANQRKGSLTSRRKLTDEEISKMGGAELRAVGHDRGYDLNDLLGARGTRAAFTKAQNEDEAFKDEFEDK